MEDLTGKQLGPYQVVAPLGQGGMAAVYKAYQPNVDRYVALKILPRHFASDPQFVARFEQEAKVLAKLQHPHILPVHDYGTADGYTYIVMPFIQNGTLADLLKGRRLPLAQIGRIISQIGDALDYAHSRGLVHRDIKPSNVLLDERGNCLLTDFGIAKILEDNSNLTVTGGIMGTPAYMSPEQGRGEKVDHRTDIYALGVILYEMATGRVPYTAETPMAVVLKHLNDPLPLPRTLNPTLPEGVERVILKALAKQPADRFASAGEMVKAILAETIRTDVSADGKTAVGTPVENTIATSGSLEDRTTTPKKQYAFRSVWLGGSLMVSAICAAILGSIFWLSPHLSNTIGAVFWTPTPTPTSTLSPTPTSTPKPTNTPTSEPTFTPSPEPTSLPTNTPMPITLNLPANAGWINTEVFLQALESVSVVTNGNVDICVGDGCTSTPDGIGYPCDKAEAESGANQQFTVDCLLKGVPYGAVIGRIGEGTPFLIGASSQFLADDAGDLFLAVNDCCNLTDNTGIYSVKIYSSASATSTAQTAPAATANAATTATAVTQLTAIARNEDLLRDDFSANRNNWWEGQATYENLGEITGQITDGKYHLSLKAVEDYWDRLAIPNLSGKDLFISVKAKVVELTGLSGDAGVQFVLRWNKESDDYYTLTFWNDGSCTFHVFHNNEWKRLATFNDTRVFEVAPGIENVFAVYMQGSSFTVYANGQNLGTVNDPTLDQAGLVGLGFGTDADKSITVEFDDLVIKKVGP